MRLSGLTSWRARPWGVSACLRNSASGICARKPTSRKLGRGFSPRSRPMLVRSIWLRVCSKECHSHYSSSSSSRRMQHLHRVRRNSVSQSCPWSGRNGELHRRLRRKVIRGFDRYLRSISLSWQNPLSGILAVTKAPPEIIVKALRCRIRLPAGWLVWSVGLHGGHGQRSRTCRGGDYLSASAYDDLLLPVATKTRRCSTMSIILLSTVPDSGSLSHPSSVRDE